MDRSLTSLIKTQAFIDGQWVGKPTHPIRDKASGEVIAEVPAMGAGEARAAVAAAHRALPAWSKLTGKERAAVLRRWFNLITDCHDELALLITREQGKPLAESRGEVTYGASFVEFFAEEAKRVHGDTIISPKADARILVLKQPIGVVASITPWNFPLAMITRKVSPALAAGCTVVVKPAETTPLTALALAELAAQAGFPPGVINVVTSADPEPVGRELTESELVRMVAFTGSTKVGVKLMQQAAGTVKRVVMELGGNAPFIVFDDADLDSAVAGAVVCKFRNAGQTCVCANRIFVQTGVLDEFTRRLTAAVGALKAGPGTEQGVNLGPLINEAAVAKVEAHIADACAKGAKVLTGGKRHALGGTFFEATVLSGVTGDMQITKEETFGPVAPLIEFSTEADVIAMANDTPFGLAGYLYSRDLGRVWRTAEALECGIVGVNEGIISNEVAPFGGVKQSGQGREGSHHGIEEFLEMKYVMIGGLAG